MSAAVKVHVEGQVWVKAAKVRDGGVDLGSQCVSEIKGVWCTMIQLPKVRCRVLPADQCVEDMIQRVMLHMGRKEEYLEAVGR